MKLLIAFCVLLAVNTCRSQTRDSSEIKSLLQGTWSDNGGGRMIISGNMLSMQPPKGLGICTQNFHYKISPGPVDTALYIAGGTGYYLIRFTLKYNSNEIEKTSIICSAIQSIDSTRLCLVSVNKSYPGRPVLMNNGQHLELRYTKLR